MTDLTQLWAPYYAGLAQNGTRFPLYAIICISALHLSLLANSQDTQFAICVTSVRTCVFTLNYVLADEKVQTRLTQKGLLSVAVHLVITFFICLNSERFIENFEWLLFVFDLLIFQCHLNSDWVEKRDRDLKMTLVLKRMEEKTQMLMTETEFHREVQALVEFTLDDCTQEGPEDTRFRIVSQNQKMIGINGRYT